MPSLLTRGLDRLRGKKPPGTPPPAAVVPAQARPNTAAVALPRAALAQVAASAGGAVNGPVPNTSAVALATAPQAAGAMTALPTTMPQRAQEALGNRYGGSLPAEAAKALTGKGSAPELIEAKGGTVKGFDEAEQLLTRSRAADVDKRGSVLVDTLSWPRGDRRVLRKGTLDTFNVVSHALAGGRVRAELEAKADADLRDLGGLRPALRAAFSGWKNRPHTVDYLLELLDKDGVVSDAMMIADAAGLVSDEKINEDLFFALIKEAPASEATEIRRLVRPHFQAKASAFKLEIPKVHDNKYANYVAYLDELLEQKSLEHARAGGGTTDLDTLAAPWIAEADRIVDTQTGVTKGKGVVTAKLNAAVRDFAVRVLQAEERMGVGNALRTRILDPGSAFSVRLAGLTFVRGPMKAKLRSIIAADLRLSEAAGYEVPEAPDDDPNPYTTKEDTAAEEAEARAAHLESRVAVASLDATLTRQAQYQKARGNEQLTTKSAGDVVDKVAGMSGEQRRLWVAKHLDDEKLRRLYLNPTTPLGVTQGLFEIAWRGIQPKLDAAQIGKSKSNHIRGMLRYADDLGDGYDRLLALAEDAAGTKVSTTTYGTRVWEIAQHLRGTDFLQIRSDRVLLDRLRRLVDRDVQSGPSKRRWDRFCDLLSLPRELKFTPDPELSGAAPQAGTGLTGWESEGEAYGAVADAVELKPKYWATLLHPRLKAPLPDKDEVYSIVHRAQNAAQRYVQHPANAQLVKDKGLDAAWFLAQVRDAMAKEHRTKLERSVPTAYSALSGGPPITVEARLRHARGHRWFGRDDMQSSLGTTKSAVIGAFEDVTGKELLEDWTNFSDLARLNQQRKEREAAKEREEVVEQALAGVPHPKAEQARADLGATEELIRSWWPSLHRGRLEWLEKNLAGRSRTEVQAMLGKRLAGAFKSDPAFKEAAEACGLDADKYDIERLLFGTSINAQREADSGLQRGFKDKKAAIGGLAGLAGNAVTPAGVLGKGQVRFGDRSASQARKGANVRYLAEQRNHRADLGAVQAEVDAVGKDAALDDAGKTAKTSDLQQKIKYLRGKAADAISDSRAAMETRTEEFDAARKNFAWAVKFVIKALFMAVVTAATLGQGTVAVLVASILAGVAKEMAAAAAGWVVYGDGFEKKELGKAAVIGALKGALRFGLGEILQVLDAIDPTLIDSATTKDLEPDVAQVITGSAVRGALAGPMLGWAPGTVRYFMDQEKPFRSFRANLDVFLAQRVSELPTFMIMNVGKEALGVADHEAQLGITGTNSRDPGARSLSYGEQATMAPVQQAIGGGGKALMGAKVGIATVVKKIWGTYPEHYKALKNGAAKAAADRVKAEDKLKPLEGAKLDEKKKKAAAKNKPFVQPKADPVAETAAGLRLKLEALFSRPGGPPPAAEIATTLDKAELELFDRFVSGSW